MESVNIQCVAGKQMLITSIQYTRQLLISFHISHLCLKSLCWIIPSKCAHSDHAYSMRMRMNERKKKAQSGLSVLLIYCRALCNPNDLRFNLTIIKKKNPRSPMKKETLHLISMQPKPNCSSELLVPFDFGRAFQSTSYYLSFITFEPKINQEKMFRT